MNSDDHGCKFKKEFVYKSGNNVYIIKHSYFGEKRLIDRLEDLITKKEFVEKPGDCPRTYNNVFDK